MEDILTKKPYAKCYELKRVEENNINSFRVFRTMPGLVTLQIRTYESISEYSTGKKRNMIAHVQLTLEEIKELAAYAEKELNP